MRSTTRRSTAVLASTLIIMLVASTPGLADPPPEEPYTFITEDFEWLNANDPAFPDYLTLEKIPYGIPPAAAGWGSLTDRRKSGQRSLWCSKTGGYYNFPTYVRDTQGWARFDLPEMADYYSAEVGFWYKQPSLGAADDRAFSVFWRYAGDPTSLTQVRGFPIVQPWSYQTLDLTDPSEDVNLSREAGKVTFSFYDFIEGYGETPSEAEGAFIDLVTFSGYAYGPVRDITADQYGSAVRVDWEKPYRATGSTTADDRTLTYRVWRAGGTGGSYSWGELTSDESRITDTEYVDTTVGSGAYTYLVQAWDTGTGDGYGSSQMASATVVEVMSLDKSVDATAVATGGSVTYTYTVTNHSGVTLTDVSVEDDKLGSIGTVTVGPNSSEQLTKTTTLSQTTSNVATATAIDPVTSGTLTAVDSATVTVVNASVSIDKSADATVVAVGDTGITYTYFVENTGDVALTNVAITDDKLGSISSGIDLSPGQTYQTTKSTTLIGTTTNVATVTGADAVLASSVDDTDSETVTVYDPDISVTKTADSYTVSAGTLVTYTYTVENTGDATLRNVVIDDDQIGVIDTITTLAPGQTAVRQASDTIDVDTTNVVDVTATYGTFGERFYGQATDSDSVTVDVLLPGITLVKESNQTTVLAGTDVVYTYTATNSGNMSLSQVSIVDDQLGTIVSGVTLAEGESVAASRTVEISSTTTNVATAEGRWGGPSELVSDTETVTVAVIAPAVTIAKSVDATVVATGDSGVEYTYTVENTGDAPLANVAITDDKLGDVATGLSLAPGATYQTTKSTTLLGTTTNVATVNAADIWLATPVSDTDSVTVQVLAPAVDVTKVVSQPVVLASTDVTYTYTVENTGDATLRNVVIDDDQIGVIDTIATLAPSQTVVRQAVETIDVDTSNVVDVTGTYGTFGERFYGQATDSDSASVDVIAPDIRVTATASKMSVPPGTSVTFTYSVKNIGDVGLSDIDVVDDSGKVGTTINSLDPGQTKTRTKTITLNSTTTRNVAVSGQDVEIATPVADTHSVTVLVSDDEIERISGSSRIETAIKMSREAYPSGGADTVVIATAYGWADALPAAALCGAVDGPLLLVEQGSLPSAVRSEIIRLGATNAYVVGGTAVVTDAVTSALDAIPGMGTPIRKGGSNRYHTAQLVGLEVKALNGGATPEKVFLATGAGFPDALAASSIAAAGQWPILLTDRYELPTNTRNALASLDPDQIVICGGSAVVDTAVGSQASAYGTIIRKGGSNRYETANLLVNWGEGALGVPLPAGVFAATGDNYPDALAGGPLAGGVGGYEWRPLLLTDPGDLSSTVRSYMRDNTSISYVGVLGGTGAVSAGVYDELEAELLR